RTPSARAWRRSSRPGSAERINPSDRQASALRAAVRSPDAGNPRGCRSPCPCPRTSPTLPGDQRLRPGEDADMKVHTEYLTLTIPSKMAFVNITPQVEEAV